VLVLASTTAVSSELCSFRFAELTQLTVVYEQEAHGVGYLAEPFIPALDATANAALPPFARAIADHARESAAALEAMAESELGGALAAFLSKPLDFAFSELTPAALAACFADAADEVCADRL
jgi:hypothetical protein